MANLKEQLARKLSTLDVPTIEQKTEQEATIMAKDTDVIQLRPQTDNLPATLDAAPPLRIYPSIASAGTPIRVNVEEPSGYTLSLFGAGGQLVWASNMDQQPVLPNLPAGVYVYKIGHKDEPRQAATGKLMVR